MQASYAELPDLTKLPQQLPEKLTEGIQRDYRNACAQFDECHTRIISSMRKQQLDALRRKAELCTQLEAVFTADQGASPDQQQLEKIKQQWDAIDVRMMQSISSRIEARREAAQNGHWIARRSQQNVVLMCIQLEIAKDVGNTRRR